MIDDDLAPKNNYDHRLLVYNNDPKTTFADVQRFFDFLQRRVEARLQDHEAHPRLAANSPAETVTQTDIAVIRKAQDFGRAVEVGQVQLPRLCRGCEDLWAILRIRGGLDCRDGETRL